MSWDAWIEIDTGGTDPAIVADLGDMTWNVSPMYYDAFGTEKGIRGLDRMIASDAVSLLNDVIITMKTNPDKYKAMNPTNKWGNYEVALKYLETIRDACDNNPKAILRVC